MFGIDNLPVILEHLLKLGVNITERQITTLKWRLSEKGQKYYTDQENVDFYKALSKGDVNVIDLTQNQKQTIIDNMLRKIPLSLFIIGLCFSLVSCISPGVPQKLDKSSIREKEKTYQLEKQQIITDSGIKEVDNNWYMVHKDFLNTFNQNQDNLIKSLQYAKDTKDDTDKLKQKLNILYGVSGCSVLIVLALIFILRKR